MTEINKTALIPDYSDTYKKYNPMLNWVEKNFQCSGVCKPSYFYIFSDVSIGYPTGNNYNSNI